MYKLYSPDTEFDLMFLKSLLEAENIKYYVHNDHFGSLKVGPSIDLFNAKTIFVEESEKEKAEGIIANYLEEQKTESIEKDTSVTKASLRIFRMFFEAFVFAWFVPDVDRYRIRKRKSNSLTKRSRGAQTTTGDPQFRENS